MDGGDPAGGSAEVARLYERCGDQLIADLKQTYNVDFRDVFKDGSGLTPRLLLLYVRQLPPESRVSAELRGGEQFLGWGIDRYHMAQLIDAVRENTFAFVSAHSKKKPTAPKPVERPDAKERRKKQNNFAAMARLHLAKQAERKAE